MRTFALNVKLTPSGRALEDTAWSTIVSDIPLLVILPLTSLAV